MARISRCTGTTHRWWRVMYVLWSWRLLGWAGWLCARGRCVGVTGVMYGRLRPQFYHTESVVKMTGPESAQVACVYVSHKMFKTIVRALLVDLNCSVEVGSIPGVPFQRVASP